MDTNIVKVLACTSVGSCVGGFVLHALPYLQFSALIVSIIAGLSAILARRR